MDLKIKICGMRDPENIRDLAALGPDYIGFIFYPLSKRFAGNTDKSVIHELPLTIRKTGVFVNAIFDEIMLRVEEFGLQTVQLHGGERPDLCLQLKKEGLEVIKAFGLANASDLEPVSEYTSVADLFLFDTKTVGHGGSGTSFDWSVLKFYKEDVHYFLSGGLSPATIPLLLQLDDPRLYGADLNSCFELAPGFKDIHQLKETFRMIRAKSRKEKQTI